MFRGGSTYHQPHFNPSLQGTYEHGAELSELATNVHISNQYAFNS